MRKTLYILLVMFVAQMVSQAQPGWREREELLEDFENGIPFGWLTMDQDESGSTWEILNLIDGKLTYGNSPHSVGCRYNNDGSQNDDWLITPRMAVPDSNRTISFYAVSQDDEHPYLESFEILVSRTQVNEDNFDPSDFELIDRYENIPTIMTEYTFETAPDFLGDSIQVAIRCISHDEYYLIVDHFQGVEIVDNIVPELYTWPTEDRNLDLGPFEVDSLVHDTVWVGNQGGDTLSVRALIPEGPGNFVDTTLILPAFTLQAIPFSFSSSVSARIEQIVNIFWGIDTLTNNLLRTGYEGLAYHPDNSLTWENFEEQAIPEGWDASYHHDTSPGWQVSDHSSGMFFSIPDHSWYGYINSDVQGEGAIQDDWFISPQLPLSGAEQMLYLTWASFFDERYDGAGEVLWTADQSPSPDSDWNVIQIESDVDLYWTTEWCRIPDSLWNEPFSLGYHFTGDNSQGWAIDDIQILIDVVVEGVAPQSLPAALTLLSPYPNPFNAELTIPLVLTSPAIVQLQLYDILGRLAWQQRTSFSSGEHLVRVQLPQLSSGVYLLRGATGEQGSESQLETAHKVILLK